MARPRKQTVDYFPHYCRGGRTIFILESRFGNDGYAFWFKLLEILGNAEGHYYNCSNGSNWAFLLAKTGVDKKRAEEIIDVLIELGKKSPTTHLPARASITAGMNQPNNGYCYDTAGLEEIRH